MNIKMNINNPIATIEFDTGKDNNVKIKIELCPNDAPNTVNSFIYLANQGVFNNFAIERIVPGYVIDVSYSAFGNEICKYLIKNESTAHGFPNHIKVEPGVIAMGGYDEGIAGGEFFFPLRYNEKLDGNYPAFGRIIEGLDEIMSLEKVELIKGSYPHHSEIEVYAPASPIVIKTVHVETFGVAYPEPLRLEIQTLPLNWQID